MGGRGRCRSSRSWTRWCRRYLDSRRRRFGRAAVRPDAVLLVDRRGEPLRRGGLQYLVESCYRRAGITDRVPRGAQLHALRHTFATRLAEDGASASEIMRLLGHASSGDVAELHRGDGGSAAGGGAGEPDEPGVGRVDVGWWARLRVWRHRCAPRGRTVSAGWVRLWHGGGWMRLAARGWVNHRGARRGGRPPGPPWSR